MTNNFCAFPTFVASQCCGDGSLFSCIYYSILKAEFQIGQSTSAGVERTCRKSVLDISDKTHVACLFFVGTTMAQKFSIAKLCEVQSLLDNTIFLGEVSTTISRIRCFFLFTLSGHKILWVGIH